MSPKTQERLLFLISPIGLIALWQVLLMAGIGDRRFVPAPSDIAYRYWEMVASKGRDDNPYRYSFLQLIGVPDA